MPGEPVKAKAIFCPNCGATVQLRGFAHTLNATCTRCLSVLDPNTPSVTLLQKVQMQMRIEPKIPMGTRGTFEGVEFEAIGFQERTIDVDGIAYSWQEYLLFHPYKGFRYLSEYNGHWNIIKPKNCVPAYEGSGRTAIIEGTKYKHFQRAVARTSYVIGEFPWQVRFGDVVTVDDYTAPPYLLSGERTAEEVSWSVGEYIEGKDVFKAFKIEAAPPLPQGVFANQPNPRANSSLWRMYMIFFLIAAFVSMYSCVAKGQREVFRKSYQFVPSSTAEPSFVTERFELAGFRNAATDVEIKADIVNNWVAFAVALINEDTGEAFDFGRDLSYYSGVDGGESWSEGGSSTTITIPSVPPGRYYLRVEPDRDKQEGDTDAVMSKTINYEIIVRHDIPAFGIVFLVLFLLLIPPVWISIRKWMFEQKRWSESDYAPVSSGGDSDSSSDD
jgi:hypothetical protein